MNVGQMLSKHLIAAVLLIIVIALGTGIYFITKEKPTEIQFLPTQLTVTTSTSTINNPLEIVILTAMLTSNGAPIERKIIKWSASPDLHFLSLITDSAGKISFNCRPGLFSYADQPDNTLTFIASFAGDDRYQGSTGSVPIIVTWENFWTSEAPHYEVVASLEWVYDGDTIDVRIENIVADLDPAGEVYDNTVERVRFGGGIDAPEMGLPRAVKAKEFVESLIYGVPFIEDENVVVYHSFVVSPTIYLDLDNLAESPSGRPYRGKYERLIAVIYVKRSGKWINVNAELLRWGMEAYPDHDWLKYMHYTSEFDPNEWLEENYPELALS